MMMMMMKGHLTQEEAGYFCSFCHISHIHSIGFQLTDTNSIVGFIIHDQIINKHV